MPQTCFIEILRIAARQKLMAKEPVIPFCIIEKMELSVFCKSIKVEYVTMRSDYMILEAKEAWDT